MSRFKVVLGGARSQNLHEDEPLEDLHCQAEERDLAVGAALFSRLPRFQYWDDDGVLPNCHDVNSSN